jgi:hypothetical protein
MAQFSQIGGAIVITPEDYEYIVWEAWATEQDADESGTFYQYVYDVLPDDDEDEIEDHEISAGNWCECGLPRAVCHIHSVSEDA